MAVVTLTIAAVYSQLIHNYLHETLQPDTGQSIGYIADSICWSG